MAGYFYPSNVTFSDVMLLSECSANIVDLFMTLLGELKPRV